MGIKTFELLVDSKIIEMVLRTFYKIKVEKFFFVVFRIFVFTLYITFSKGTVKEHKKG
jgi:hypothetical protein